MNEVDKRKKLIEALDKVKSIVLSAFDNNNDFTGNFQVNLNRGGVTNVNRNESIKV